MRMFHHLFGREKREGYLAHIRDAVDEELGRLRADGELDVFPHMKRLVHVVGFRSWAGREASSPRYLSRLIALFERLDPEEAFVRPARTFVTLLTRKALERRALAEIADILREIWDDRQRRGVRESDMLEALHELYAADPPAARHAKVARDVVVLHLASLSNLYAAMAWTLVNLLDRPQHLARCEAELRDVEARRGAGFLEDSAALDELRFLGEVAYESIRHAQRSITLRKVLKRCEVDDGSRVYSVEPGVYIATLLSVSNGLHGTMDRYDPAHYERDRIAPSAALPTRESVSTFGHGIHTCPGQRFAVSAIKIVVARHLQSLALTPRFKSPRPKTSQIGAVGRAEGPCLARYHRR
jgi:cytochrome P450